MQEQDNTQSVAPTIQTKPKRQFSLGTLIGVVVVVGLGAFVLGLRAPGVWAMAFSGQNQQLSQSLDFSSVQQVYNKLHSEFDGKLDQQKLIDGAKKGLVEAAGDPYTVYFTDDEAKQFFGDLEGKFSGIGAELGRKDEKLVVVSTLDDSPARRSGLLAGDAVAKVNDQETTGWSIEKAVSIIRGDKDTTVKLMVVRGQEVKEFSIVRAEINSPSVTHEITPDNIGVMRISRFAENDTTALTQQFAKEFKDKGVKGIVVDVRGNGGGYLTAAQQVASLWLKQGDVIVQERVGDKVKDTLKATGKATLEGVPTTILIDGGSASASEILAGALRDHNAAKLVGTKTFGKGSVQQILEIASGGQLKVTIAKWFTPNGKNISKEGIEPDVKVEPTDADIAAQKDVQKDRALELLKK